MNSHSTQALFRTGITFVAILVAGVALGPVDVVGPNAAYAQQGQGKGGGQGKGSGQGRGGQHGRDGEGRGTGSAVEEGVMRGQGKGRYSDFIRPDHDDADHDDADHDHEDGDEESDRPDYAGPNPTAPKPGSGGNKGAVTDRGSLFGDLWVIERDPLTGEPIFYVWEDTDGDGTLDPVQSPDGFPQPIDAEGNLIPLDNEGHPLDESLVQEVELGRLNVARAPDTVAARAYDEALATLAAATEIQLDAAGRLEALIDGEWKTIDSPLENLAIYISLMDDGHIEGLEDNSLVAQAFPNLVDNQFDTTDVQWAATFLAAAADKVGTVTLDEAMYLNNIIGVEIDESDLATLTSFSYDRALIYSGVEATVLVDPDQDGTWTTETVDIYEAVFDSTNVTGAGTTGFSQATDDARAVVNFLHEYEVPVYDPEAASH